MLLVGSLILWAGVATVQQMAKIGSTVNVQERVENLKEGFQKSQPLSRLVAGKKCRV